MAVPFLLTAVQMRRIRPQTLADFSSQASLRENLLMFIAAARQPA